MVKQLSELIQLKSNLGFSLLDGLLDCNCTNTDANTAEKRVILCFKKLFFSNSSLAHKTEKTNQNHYGFGF